ncbi:hypothetical protein L1987_30155 [Smallanthus sonchifolius]|uniref:Uncharacterized protein n=1 Tax=Smallanthus sonchifolius TaxID=185202 RepID=A0ACB9I4P4_9ASTR|nr:hypothetical protein L1987_30155 [Smallanthus sonchifolius]
MDREVLRENSTRAKMDTSDDVAEGILTRVALLEAQMEAAHWQGDAPDSDSEEEIPADDEELVEEEDALSYISSEENDA